MRIYVVIKIRKVPSSLVMIRFCRLKHRPFFYLLMASNRMLDVYNYAIRTVIKIYSNAISYTYIYRQP